MDKNEIIKTLGKKSNGDIYLGIVGSVRTGKSTFIKKCIESLILPYINEEDIRKRCLDEIPQTAPGNQIMTIEPKFVPSEGANIKLGDTSVNIKLVDCVGYITKGSIGYENADGSNRMIQTPWQIEPLPFSEAAMLGTNKVIRDHATIGIVITSDGSFNEIERNSYEESEEKVINELKGINKPFIVILNSNHPNNSETINLSNSLNKKYNVPVIPISIENMNERDITSLLKEALNEFPVEDILFKIPDWIGSLDKSSDIKSSFIDFMKNSVKNIFKVRDISNINIDYSSESNIRNAYISEINNDGLTITIDAKEELFDNILKDTIGCSINSKGDLLRAFKNFSDGKSEYDSIKGALKQVYQTGYGIVLPKINDMKLDKPEVIKQGSKYGVKLKATASSIHMVKVDVDSSFEPIIGSETQSKELLEHMMKDDGNVENLWKSEIFGRSLDAIVEESIKAKLSLLPDSVKYKLSQIITKMVNKGSNNLIAIVL